MKHFVIIFILKNYLSAVMFTLSINTLPVLQARIKAINTFFAKNGYGAVDSTVYTGNPQSQYSSPVYLQQMYQPPQQYPVYSLLPQAWTPSPTPYFETPLVRTTHIQGSVCKESWSLFT